MKRWIESRTETRYLYVPCEGCPPSTYEDCTTKEGFAHITIVQQHGERKTELKRWFGTK